MFARFIAAFLASRRGASVETHVFVCVFVHAHASKKKREKKKYQSLGKRRKDSKKDKWSKGDKKQYHAKYFTTYYPPTPKINQTRKKST